MRPRFFGGTPSPAETKPGLRAASAAPIKQEQPDPARAAGRLDAHGFDQVRARIELFVRDPHRFGIYTAGDQGVRFSLDLGRIQQAHVDIEIEPALVGRNVSTRHRSDHDTGHHVQCRVQPHEGVTSSPIDLHADRLADFQRRGHRVEDTVRGGALAGIRNSDTFSARPDENPSIARLSAPQGVEKGPIELDATLMDLHDGGRSSFQVGIGAKEQFSHGGAALQNQ